MTGDGLRNRLGSESLAMRDAFGWDAIARKTMEVYRQVMAG